MYSNNWFQSPTAPISAISYGITPALTAEFTDGIHKTSVYGSADNQLYPTDNQINSFNRQAGFIQSYAPLVDLSFQLHGDYTHLTLSNPLTNGIPGAITAPISQLLPNGNTLLPNGQIISPTGQLVGQGIPAFTTGTATNVVNPVDQFTATASVEKLFNRGVVQFAASVQRNDYQTNLFTPDYTVATLSGHGAFWVAPLFYLYSDGVTANRSNSSAHRAVGGIGSGQPLDLFQTYAYFGHQGSEQDASGSAGGVVYGGGVIYAPTLEWTIRAAVDKTVNNSNQTATSTTALTLPIPAPLLIPESAGTSITASTLQSSYRLSPQWATSARVAYTRVNYIDSIRTDNAFVADAYVSYDIWRNMTLSWEYQYSSVSSNVPFVSASRNLLSMSALYKF
jgi:opacity protein-like surface antigen